VQVEYASPVLVGREAESARLRDAFAASTAGEPRTVLVAGESGVGKSRVVAEFVAGLGEDARVLLGGCVDLRAGDLPFAPFTAALRSLVAEHGADGLRELLPPGAASSLSALLPGLNGPAPAAGDDARARMFEYLLALLAGLAEEQPLVLVLEDLHWADRSSLDLLDFLVRSQQSAPGWLIVLTLRSPELSRAHPLRNQLAELARLPWVHRLDLRRLTRPEVTHLAREVVDREPDPEVLESIYRRSEGNPLFVEELLRCHLDGSDCRVPPSLHDLLLERVHRLPEPARQVVRVASVASGRIAHPVLANVIAQSTVDLDVDPALRAAVDGAVLVVDGDGYAFRHALIREAVYDDLLPGERTALHLRYADVLRAEGLPAGAISHHLFSAGDLARGLPAAWQASREAHRALAYAEELVLLECIREHWDDLPDTADVLGVRPSTLLEAAVEAAVRAGAHDRGVELATAALEAIDPEVDRVRTALMLERRGTMRTSLGRPTALDDHREATRVIPDDHPARAYLLNSLATRLMSVPEPEEAQRVAAEALRIAREVGDPSVEASALITLAVLRARTGDLDEQLPEFARARAIAESIGATQVALRAWHSESHLLQAFGRLDEAAELARTGLAAATEAGLARAAGPQHVVDLAGALIDAGRWDEAVDAIEFGIGLAPPAGSHAHLLNLRAFVDLHRGDLDAATRATETAADLVARGPMLPQDPLLFERLEAELLLARGDVAAALRVVADALSQDHLMPATRFVWPLLVIGAQAVAAAARESRTPVGESVDAVPPLLHKRAAELRANGPVQAAWAITFGAEVSSVEGTPDRAAWTAAVSAWERLAQPLRLAQTLTGAAEAALVGSDRDACTVALRRAAGIAERLTARGLTTRIDSLARRARIPLNGSARGSTSSHGLTARELEILHLVADGRSNAQIAGELFIAPKTASVHVSHILAKLGVANRVEAAAAAHRLGLLDSADV
jgi:ATP/maltotriose-dependent transcriptional regulator MalT